MDPRLPSVAELDRRFRAASKLADSAEAYRAEDRAGDAFAALELLPFVDSAAGEAALRRIMRAVDRFEVVVR